MRGNHAPDPGFLLLGGLALEMQWVLALQAWAVGVAYSNRLRVEIYHCPWPSKQLDRHKRLRVGWSGCVHAGLHILTGGLPSGIHQRFGAQGWWGSCVACIPLATTSSFWRSRPLATRVIDAPVEAFLHSRNGRQAYLGVCGTSRLSLQGPRLSPGTARLGTLCQYDARGDRAQGSEPRQKIEVWAQGLMGHAVAVSSGLTGARLKCHWTCKKSLKHLQCMHLWAATDTAAERIISSKPGKLGKHHRWVPPQAGPQGSLHYPRSGAACLCTAKPHWWCWWCVQGELDGPAALCASLQWGKGVHRHEEGLKPSYSWDWTHIFPCLLSMCMHLPTHVTALATCWAGHRRFNWHEWKNRAHVRANAFWEGARKHT